tara:strand:- start:1 stop:606 length:606 start_codon:yes stop_codon:yes gene_type:complete
MSIVKLNNRSVKDITQFGSISILGSLTHIATQTASTSSSIDFTSGIDSTYKEYIFYFVNIHAGTNDAIFSFQADTGTNTNYNQTITSTAFTAQHGEGGSPASLFYNTGGDLAQGTGLQQLSEYNGTENDHNSSGYLHLFNPSSSTFVKHFISVSNLIGGEDRNRNGYNSGYINTTTAITRIRFKMDTGNIDSGQILLFGLN